MRIWSISVLVSAMCIAAPAFGGTILFVASSDPVPAGDDVIKARMEGLGHTVVVADDDLDDAALQAAAVDKDLIVISESTSSSKVNTAFIDTPVNLICGETGAWSQLGIATSNGSNNTSELTMDIAMAGHPLVGGMSGSVNVFSGTPSDIRFTGNHGGDAQVIATLPGEPTLGSIIFYDAGVVDANGSITPAARLSGFFGNNNSAELRLTEAGLQIFEAQVEYLIPEPTTLSLLALAGIGLLRKRRR